MLLVALAALHRGPPTALAIPTFTERQSPPEQVGLEKQGMATNLPAPVLSTARFHWGLIESTDYHQYIANLRAINCPERLIRDVIIADVTKLYAGKMRELNSGREVWQPWYGADRRQIQNRERSTRYEALQAERRALLKELLGIEWAEPWDGDATFALALGFLPEPKPTQIFAVIEEFSEATRAIHQENQGILLEEDREQLAQLRKGLMAKFANLMTPTEYEELNLRAQGMGKFTEGELHLDGVTLSGSEFRQLCGLSRITGDVIQDELLEGGRTLTEEEEERQQRAFEAEVKKLLGPARFAEFQRAQQPEFRDAIDFTEEHQLPVSTAARISDAVRQAQQQANEIRQNESLSPEEQAAALTVLKSVTVNALSSALGAKYATYAKSKGTDLDDLFEMTSDPPEETP